MSDSADTDCPTDLVSKGIKAYWLKDYQTSVSCLSKASAMLYTEHQDAKFDGLGNVQLYYGKALLELSREAADPLGQIIPREVGRAPRPDEVVEGDDLGEEEESEVEIDGEDSSSGEEEEVEEEAEASPDTDAKEDQTNGNSNAKTDVAEVDDDYLSSATNDSQEDVGTTAGRKTSKPAKPDTSTDIIDRDNVVTSSDDMNGTTELQSSQDSGCEEDPPQASTSTGDNAEENKTAATFDDLNGNSDEDTDAEAVGNEEGDELSDLQLSWEVLEVAKEIFQKRGEAGREDFADAMITLGEISMENGNFGAAIADIRQGLAIQCQIFQEPKDMRKLAQSYYILGTALCGNEEFSEGLAAYEATAKLLKERLALLKAIENPRESDEREIADITSVLPDVDGKIKDVVACQEAKKQKEEQEEQAKNEREVAGVSSNSDKKVNNISHLVKRKRDEVNDFEESVAKKATA